MNLFFSFSEDYTPESVLFLCHTGGPVLGHILTVHAAALWSFVNTLF